MDKEPTAFTPDPLVGSLLGLCPVIFVTSNFGAGVIVGMGVLVTALCVSLLLPALRSLFPDRLRAPLAFGLTASITALFASGASLYSPVLSAFAGIFLPLTLVNCLVLLVLRRGIRQDMPATPVLITVLRYFMAIIVIAAIREILGKGSLTLPLPGSQASSLALIPFAPLAILSAPAGGFLLLGCLAALYRFVQRRFLGRRIP